MHINYTHIIQLIENSVVKEWNQTNASASIIDLEVISIWTLQKSLLLSSWKNKCIERFQKKSSERTGQSLLVVVCHQVTAALNTWTRSWISCLLLLEPLTPCGNHTEWATCAESKINDPGKIYTHHAHRLWDITQTVHRCQQNSCIIQNL